MEYIIICFFALLGSGLTLISGFGLGTILVPVFAIFFPIEIAIALTAIVHFLNNIFKLLLVGRFASKKIIFHFGVPAIISSFLGAFLLTILTDLPSIYDYIIFDTNFSILPVKLTISILLIAFSLFEIIPKFSNIKFDEKYLPIGGVLSGFFGGLSGNQGALRSAFLIRSDLNKETFIATGVVIACLIDVSRLIVYSKDFVKFAASFNYTLIIAATLSAFLGAYIGNRFMKKITIKTIKNFVAIMLLIFAVCLGIGLI